MAAPPSSASPPPPQGGGQPPFGSSPATGPTPNRGFEAAGMQKLGLIIKQLNEILPMLAPASDAWKATHDALGKLVKAMPDPSSPASDKTNIQQMAMKQAQNAAMAQKMQAGGGQGGAPQMPGMQPQQAEAA